ncbi:MAG TPA: hypothetical protein VIC82_06095 [Candidatus Nanopelagicales bacterium]|jgi:hypothetical protein
MSRTARRRALRAVAPVAGLLAAGLLVWQGSYAAFSATTTSPTNNWATGQVSLLNSTNAFATPIGTAAFTVANMAPSATAVSKCITVQSNGNLAGNVKLYAANVTPSVVGTNQLSANISVTISEMTAGVTNSNVTAACVGFVANATTPLTANLNALPTTYGTGFGTFAPTGAATQYSAYKITYLFNPGPAVADVQGKSASADFVWEIQSS